MGHDIAVESKEGETFLINEGSGLEDIFNKTIHNQEIASGEIVFVTSYPPRECGIASYSQNLIQTINGRFNNYFRLTVCALEKGTSKYYYPEEVTNVLNVEVPADYKRVSDEINNNIEVKTVVIQHEFDLFKSHENALLQFISDIKKPVIIVFHTIITKPDENLRSYIGNIVGLSKTVLVMAKISRDILAEEYSIPKDKIEVIPYGTHLVTQLNGTHLKEKYKFTGRIVLSTIGLLSPGKGIETTLDALPAVIKNYPEILFLVIGKTHPEEFKIHGEKYRIMLESKVKSLKLQNHVHFLNGFFNYDTLKEYFLLSDISIFSSVDSNRPMSGMFSFAVSCGCPVLSVKTSHANEFLDDANLTFESKNAADLAAKIIRLIENPSLRKETSEGILKKAHSAIWENSALSHVVLFNHIIGNNLPVDFAFPEIKLDFLKSITDRVGILHSTYKGEPDLRLGYTLDDNALALYVFCMHYKITCDTNDIGYIKKYLKFIYHCYLPSAKFLKYMNYERKFTNENDKEDLEETQAKAIWALGYLFSMKDLLPFELTDMAGIVLENLVTPSKNFQSGKSIALAIKGFYYYYSANESAENCSHIKCLADKLITRYESNALTGWRWFDNKFSSSASIFSGALLNTWLITGEAVYKQIARESFDFLLSRMFKNDKVEIDSNDWNSSHDSNGNIGEQPCDIAFSVITLSKFYLMFKDNDYYNKMNLAFKWFLGNNRLGQMVYNPVTTGCFDGMEAQSVNLNQSAESALSYVVARMVVEKYKFKDENHLNHIS